MSCADVANFAGELLKKKGLANQIISVTDPAKINIGHTIPSTSVDWNKEEKEILKGGEKNWEMVKKLISKKRVFVNISKQWIIIPKVAFTIEPRPKKIDDRSLPTALSYHTIGIIKENGKKELITDFDSIFKLAGMNYMLK